MTPIGALTPSLRTPVSMADNGATLVVVDGSPNGWAVDLTTHAFQQINDSTGTFQGATKVDYIDTFLVFGPSPPPATTQSNAFISTTSGQVQFNALYVAGKTDYPDPLVGLIVNRHEILLLGTVKSEIWYDAGNPQLPFAELPGAYIEHGCAAAFSVASSDISVFWLAQSLQGQGVVLRQRGYTTQRISNHALEYALRQVVRKAGTLADATAYTYQQDGHYFYVLTLPSGDQTWVFDDSIQDPMLAWHQRAFNDDGVLRRERPMSHAFFGGENVVQDWENGALYAMDPEYYADTVDGIDHPIRYLRTFPHIGRAYSEQGQLIEANGKQIEFSALILDMECGTIPWDNTSGAPPPAVTIRYSDDRGRTFSGSLQLRLGANGEYLTWPTARVLGRARDRIFEIEWTGNGEGALNGAWIEGHVLHN
jgi:outer membrane protein assembly factor BamB